LTGTPAITKVRRTFTHAASLSYKKPRAILQMKAPLPVQRSGKHLIDTVVWCWHAACDRKS
ncbi:MAG TPA: hypothetical protein VGT81_13665, partial [Casimicrobiaceae bacterium]|nr:hypothetical protein [Casimicrobiaceae bacterium]